MRNEKNQGPADKGSQSHIQKYVNRATDYLDFLTWQYMMRSDRTLVDVDRYAFEWVSPLECENYREYSDSSYFEKLGLGHCSTKLAEFWPKGGPCWDALGKIRLEYPDKTVDGVVLVEAKAHLGEIVEGDSSGAKAQDSIDKIKSSLLRTREFFGVPAGTPCWTQNHYQVCNRLAHLYFMNEVLNVPTWLVWFLVLDDQDWNDHADFPAWESKFRTVYSDIGLPSNSCEVGVASKNKLSDKIVYVYARPFESKFTNINKLLEGRMWTAMETNMMGINILSQEN